jgi:hypothetical protein
MARERFEELYEVDADGELSVPETVCVRCPHCQQVQEVTEAGSGCCVFCRRGAPAEAWDEVVGEPRPPCCPHCDASLEALDGNFQMCPECGWEDEPDDWVITHEVVTCEKLGYPPLVCPGCGLSSGDEYDGSFVLRYDGRAECVECGKRFIPDHQFAQEDEADPPAEVGEADEPVILQFAAVQG